MDGARGAIGSVLSTGRPFPDVVEQEVFVPLGMTSSSFRQPLPDALVRRLAKGYEYRDGDRYDALPLDYSNIAPADTLVTTGDDMARFMLARFQSSSLEIRCQLAP